MTNKGAKFLHLANWVVAAFLAFVWVVQWDEVSPLPVQAALTVTSWDGNGKLDDLRRDTAAFASEHGITFGQEVVDFEQRNAVRNLYLVDGDPAVPGASWLAGGYRDFAQSTTTRIHPYGQLGNRTPVGRYDVFGSPAKAAELRDFLASRGLPADLDTITMWNSVPSTVSLALCMMIFFSIVVVGAAVLSGVRAYGVGRLQGLSYGSLLLADLRAGTTFWVGSGAVVTIGALVFAALYNGLAAYGTYAAAMVVIDLVLTAVAFGANALVLLMIMQLRIQAALKGELPGRTASAMAYVLRAVAVLVTVGTLTTTLDVGTDLGSRLRSYDAYQRLGTTSALSLGNAYTLAEQKKLGDTVGAWLRDQDRAGHIVLAGQEILRDPNPLLNGRTVLYVNEAFLADQPVRLATGGNYRAGGGLDVLVPSSLRGHEDAVAATFEALFHQDAKNTKFRAVDSADGQSFFTYAIPSSASGNPGFPVPDRANVSDPLIVVLPAAQGLLSNDSYAAFASSAMVLFPHPAVVKDAVAADQALQTYVRAVVPLAEQAAVEQQTVARELRLALLTALIGMLVLVITGIGVVLIHARRNSQLIFARHVNGWSFPAVHRGLLAVEAVVLLVLIGVLPYQVWRQNQELAVYQLTAGPAVSMTAAVALLLALMVCGMLAALAHTHRRVVRDGASEA